MLPFPKKTLLDQTDLLGRPPSNAATKPATPDVGRVLELPGGNLQVREDGPRDAPPIVLLHCFACSMKWWEPVVGELALRNRVIRIDLLGHGGSEKPTGGSTWSRTPARSRSR